MSRTLPSRFQMARAYMGPSAEGMSRSLLKFCRGGVGKLRRRDEAAGQGERACEIAAPPKDASCERNLIARAVGQAASASSLLGWATRLRAIAYGSRMGIHQRCGAPGMTMSCGPKELGGACPHLYLNYS